MAGIRLLDLVLLSSKFETWPDDASGADSQVDPSESSAARLADDRDEPYEYPSGDFLQLEAWLSREAEMTVLIVRALLDDDALPFMLDVTLGAQFALDDLPEETSQTQLEKTLTWLCYPYIREIVSSITARSPLPTYFLPAITRMPVQLAKINPASGEAADAPWGRTLILYGQQLDKYMRAGEDPSAGA